MGKLNSNGKIPFYQRVYNALSGKPGAYRILAFKYAPGGQPFKKTGLDQYQSLLVPSGPQVGQRWEKAFIPTTNGQPTVFFFVYEFAIQGSQFYPVRPGKLGIYQHAPVIMAKLNDMARPPIAEYQNPLPVPPPNNSAIGNWVRQSFNKN